MKTVTPRLQLRCLRSTTFVVIGLLALLYAPALQAQVLYGSIVGVVRDATGAVLPGATVTITHNETKATRETTTDQTGAYRFSTVQSGTYTVVAALTGMQTVTRNDVPVTLNTVARVDVTLGAGQLQETVTVSADSPLLQTDRAEVREELRARELQDLPVPIGRNYQELFVTLPGFTPPADAHSVPSNPSRALTFNVNGASNQGNNTRIDGVSSTNVWLPHVVAYVPALESIETVNVVTNNFDAEQGLAGGAAISVQIKSGTNQIRGSAFEYHFNEQMRAKNFFTPPGTNKGQWLENQFGGTLGGPIKQNKLFYFVSYEGTRQNRQVPNTESVPTQAVKNGDFSGTGTTIYDPLTGNPDGTGRTPFPDNVIPQDRISEVAQRIITHWPEPNLPGDFDNYFVQPRFIFNRWTVDSKVNWNATDRLQIFGRYSQLDFYQDNETVLGEQLQGAPGAGGNPGIGWGDTFNFSGGVTYTLGNNVVFDANMGWVRMTSNVEMSDLNENKGLDWLGIPGTNGPDPWDGGTPFFNLDGYADLGTTQDFMPYYRDDEQYQFVGNVTWLKGSHNIRFGSDMYFTTMNHIQPEILDDSMGSRGGFAFDGGPTQLRGGPGGTDFNSFASFLLGLPSEAGRLKLNVAPYTTRSWQYSFYVRDQWQVGPRVTLSFGTRYEYFPIPTRADRGLERYNLDTNTMEIGGLDGVPEDLGIKMQKNLFAPRFGATYRITDTTVLRGGFGITNDPYSLSRSMRTNHPVLLNLLDEAAHSFTWVRPIEEGIPIIPDPDLSSGIIPVPGNVTVVTLPNEFDRGRVWSWNAAFEKELLWGLVGEAAYIGTRQINQLGQREQNWSPIGGGSAGRQLFQQFGRTAATILIAPIGDTHYNALQTRISRRFRDGFSFNVNYTLSKAVGLAGASNSDQQPRVRIPDLYHLNEAVQDFDRTHTLNMRSIVELPFGPGRRWLSGGGVVAAIVGGWQLNNVVSLRSGTPFTVTTSTTPLNAAGSINQNPADQVKDAVEILGGIGDGNSWFDPFAFAVVSEPRLGNSGFNSMRGPSRKQWDIGLFRQINLGRQANLQLRVEAFNVTNTPHFGNPGSNRSSLRLNPDGTIRDLNGYTEIRSTTGSKSERQLRLGIRLGF
ncbi:MAG: TonB-dependent receptor domain-containing protein [Vicinamibacterales bacterium]